MVSKTIFRNFLFNFEQCQQAAFMHLLCHKREEFVNVLFLTLLNVHDVLKKVLINQIKL